MTIGNAFLAELKQEAQATKKLLELVPMDKADWKPHDKNTTLGRLATHIAEIPSWFGVTLMQDELDFAKSDFKPYTAQTNEELVEMMEKNIKDAEAILNEFPDEKMNDGWTMRTGDEIYFTLPKVQVTRTWCLNHWYHHRAQLGVYLRLLDIPLPNVYGPTADDMQM